MVRPVHIPVLVKEALETLGVHPRGYYIDCTFGGGGHAAAILEYWEHDPPRGWLLGIDADSEAVKAAQSRLDAYGDSIRLVHDNFVNFEAICHKQGFFLPMDGVLFDLGLSSPQLEDSMRGFSFQHDGPLDMRFSHNQKLTAAEIVNSCSEAELAHLIWTYGEEVYNRRIARQIVLARPIRTTLQLVQVVKRAVGSRRGRIHPATKTFQALRIVVNQELENLKLALKQAVNLLDSGGRLVVISYHSLEDRIVKQFMQREASDCVCPSVTPICVCGHKARLSLINKKVITPSPAEIQVNPRSRSAKLRAAERIGDICVSKMVVC